MANKYQFHIFGDSNVARYLSVVKARKSDPVIKDVSFTRTTNAVQLREELSNPKLSSPVVIIAALTNLLTVGYQGKYDKLVSNCSETFNNLLDWIKLGRESVDGFGKKVQQGETAYSGLCTRIGGVRE